jgi:hemolysin activation/secretion protein
MGSRSRTLLASFALLACASLHAQETLPTDEELEARGATVGEITVVIKDVFDTSLPEEDKGFYRLANKLHIDTRERVIRRQLLFKSGQPYSRRLLRETERVLRGNRYLFDADIVPVRHADGVVDIEVRTQDVWTLKPSFNFTRSGGENSSGFDLQESNLLGYGKEVTVRQRRNVDRDALYYSYFDPQVFGSWNRFFVSYASNSDGRTRSAVIDRPFYAFDTRWAGGVSAFDSLRTDQRFDLSRAVDEFKHDQQRVEAFAGWSSGWQDGWVWRVQAGGAFERDRFAPTASLISAATLPLDRELAYPFVELSLLEDNFEERRNQDQIERTEDFYSGAAFNARIGRASGTFGADRAAWLWRVSGGNAFESAGRAHTLRMSAAASGRIESGATQNFLSSAAAAYYWRIAKRHLLFASVRGVHGDDLDADAQILLGGDNGLRGYPLRYQRGDTLGLFTLEYRAYSDWYLFRIFHVGGAVFFDMGRTWGRGDIAGVPYIDTNLGMLKDLGLGLRFGSSRSAFGNVIHLDLAFPLDGERTIDNVQFIVETKRSF